MNDNNPFLTTKWVDAAKGIGILSVIAGHIFTGYVSTIIYLYHMPFFFFVAGFLYSKKERSSYLIDKAKRLLTPYFIYLIAFFLLTVSSMYFSNELTPLILIKMIVKNIYGGEFLAGWQGVFWFVSVFFISQQLLNFLIVKYSLNTISFIVLLMLIMAYIVGRAITIPLPLNCGVVLYALPIMYVGYLTKINAIKFNIFLIIFITIAAIISSWYFPQELKVNLKSSDYGIPIVNFIISIAIIYFIAWLSNLYFAENRFLKYCGKNSMTIMYIHQFIHFAMAEKLFSSQSLIFIFTLTITLLVCYLGSYAKHAKKLLPNIQLGNR